MGTVIVLTSKSYPNYVVACENAAMAELTKAHLDKVFWEGEEFEITTIPVLSSSEDLDMLPK
jgi:hypothetical protein